MAKYLDQTGLQKVLAKIIEFVKTSISAIPAVTSSANGLMTSDDKNKLDGIAEGANVNVIEKIFVNGSNQTVTEKGVNITVPTDLKDLANTTTDFQSGTQVDNKIAAAISSTYKPGGSKTATELSDTLLTKENEGKVFNVSEEFTTTDKFVDNTGKKYPAGTNVVVINTASSGDAVYKFDVLAGFIDTESLKTEALSEDEINSAWQSANVTE